MTQLNPGDAFLFRFHRWWHVLHRGYGGAKVVAVEPEDDVMHLCILGMEEGSIINHVPIWRPRVLAAFLQVIHAEKPEWQRTTHAWEDLANWRDAVSRGEAAAFDLPLPETLGLICDTWGANHPNRSDPMRIASAYPIRGANGVFNTVRVIEWVD